MTDKEDQVLLLGFIMIAGHFFFGGQFKIIWNVVTTKPPKPVATPGPGTTLKPFFQGLIPGAPINTSTNTKTNNGGNSGGSQHAPTPNIIPPLVLPPSAPPISTYHFKSQPPLPWWDPRTWGWF